MNSLRGQERIKYAFQEQRMRTRRFIDGPLPTETITPRQWKTFSPPLKARINHLEKYECRTIIIYIAYFIYKLPVRL